MKFILAYTIRTRKSCVSNRFILLFPVIFPTSMVLSSFGPFETDTVIRSASDLGFLNV